MDAHNTISYLESVINKTLRTQRGIDVAKLDCEGCGAPLKIVKKKRECDVMIAGFSRRFIVSHSNVEQEVTGFQRKKLDIHVPRIAIFLWGEGCDVM